MKRTSIKARRHADLAEYSVGRGLINRLKFRKAFLIERRGNVAATATRVSLSDMVTPLKTDSETISYIDTMSPHNSYEISPSNCSKISPQEEPITTYVCQDITMMNDSPHVTRDIREVISLTKEWGDWNSVSLYLDRCQVDTPPDLVRATWAHVEQLRPSIGKVLDFGAGDARFATRGRYAEYVGYEIDAARCAGTQLPKNARLLNRCAFTDETDDADLCIGNPPFVRNQDLPLGWREQAALILKRRLGIEVSGLANAWQYFFLQSLASLKDDGLCALVIPYEWVSRPSARALREFISSKGWGVSVYRLVDTTFSSVLTTSSITIVDKSQHSGIWRYFRETADGDYQSLLSPSGAADGVLSYARRGDIGVNTPRAIRGLSPGTQKVLTLTEGERVRSGLSIGDDVVPCITTMRTLPAECKVLDGSIFDQYFRMAGQKCWLIRTDRPLSEPLKAYLDAVDAREYQTATCLDRKDWWDFKMPPVPAVLMAQSFKGQFPKGVRNDIAARAVGGVSGIHNANEEQAEAIIGGLNGLDLRDRVVAHSNGLRKIEINQLNALFIAQFEAKGACVQTSS